MSFSDRARIPAHVLIQELAGESVLLDLNSEQYFGLDDVATRMWQVVTTADSIQAGYDRLVDEFEVDPLQLQQDLQQLIEELVGHGLLELQKC